MSDALSSKKRVDDSIPAVLRRRLKELRGDGYNFEFCRVFERAAEALERGPVELPTALHCTDCKLLYGDPGWADFVVSDAVWQRIAPEGGVLCVTCMFRRMAAAGIERVDGAFTSGPCARHDWRKPDEPPAAPSARAINALLDRLDGPWCAESVDHDRKEAARAIRALRAPVPPSCSPPQAIRTVIEEMVQVATSGDPDDMTQEWTADNRDQIDRWQCRLRDAITSGPPSTPLFQERVHTWMGVCFTPDVVADKVERNHRYVEESLELVQALGCTREEAHMLVDYVFGRPAGEPRQEAGGAMVTLAALGNANGINVAEAADAELTRCWTKIDQIRAKQAGKPKHSPLPGPSVMKSASCRCPAKPGEACPLTAEQCQARTAAPREFCRANSDGICDWIACPRSSSDQACSLPRASAETSASLPLEYCPCGIIAPAPGHKCAGCGLVALREGESR